MQVILNGEQQIIAENSNLAEALQLWGYTMDMPIAVAVNYKVIHKQDYAHTILSSNAVIEVLMPMQGG